MVTASGMKVLARVDFKKVGNLYIVAISLAVGLLPVVSPQFFNKLPSALGPILESPILLTAIVATLLNLFFNGVAAKPMRQDPNQLLLNRKLYKVELSNVDKCFRKYEVVPALMLPGQDCA